MKKLLPFFILSFFIFSCNKENISSSETKIVQKILQFYGGICEGSKGFESKNNKKIDYFEIDVSKSQLLNKDVVNLTKHAGNIAYLFYSNLMPEEKKNYNEIRVKIDLNSAESRSYKYKISELEGVLSVQGSLEEINYLIISKDYKKLSSLFSSDMNVKENDLKELFDKIHANFGEIKEIQYQGHEFYTDDKFGDGVTFKQVIVMDQSIQMFVTYQMKTKKLIGIYFP